MKWLLLAFSLIALGLLMPAHLCPGIPLFLGVVVVPVFGLLRLLRQPSAQPSASTDTEPQVRKHKRSRAEDQTAWELFLFDEFLGGDKNDS